MGVWGGQYIMKLVFFNKKNYLSLNPILLFIHFLLRKFAKVALWPLIGALGSAINVQPQLSQH